MPHLACLALIVVASVVHGEDGPGRPVGTAKPIIEWQSRRPDTRVRVSDENGASIWDVQSDFGIDRARFQRTGEAWPSAVIIRLHLRGLESFQVTRGDLTVDWSVSSSPPHATRMTLRRRTEVAGHVVSEETELDSKSPYFAPVRATKGEIQIPMTDAAFEIALPKQLFEDNPAEISLQWIDFYRN